MTDGESSDASRLLDPLSFSSDSPPPATADGVPVTPITAICDVLPRNPLDEAAIKLNELVLAISQSEASKPAGEVTITFKVRKATNIEEGVVLSAKVTSKVPKEPETGAIFFTDDDGGMHTRTPRQRDMFGGPNGRKSK